MEGASRARETRKEAVYAADGTLALGGRPWGLKLNPTLSDSTISCAVDLAETG
jgi:hypothetical protein